MANLVASVSPSAPIIAIYIQEIGKIPALPQGAAETGPMCNLEGSDSPSREVKTGWLGRKGTKCFATPIGPTPGPPPPCGMQKVLWRFKWQTSAPMNPGEVKPTCAFRLAPSM